MNKTEELKEKLEIRFGDIVSIYQKRYGVPNEPFGYKVINCFRSNLWVDVPIQVPDTETLHTEVEDVVSCICIGVEEREVLNYRVQDVKLVKSGIALIKQSNREVIKDFAKHCSKEWESEQLDSSEWELLFQVQINQYFNSLDKGTNNE